MKWFVLWADEGLTGNYHDNGAAVVFAKDEEHAKQLLCEDVAGSEWKPERDLVVKTIEPAEEGQVYIFPDAGCC